MKNPYEDILGLPRPVSRRRMNPENRAAQFAPFAALTGFDDTIAETGRRTESQIEQAEDIRLLLDWKLRQLLQRQDDPMVLVTAFVPDEKKSGGLYRQTTGRIKGMDENKGTLLLADGTEIRLENILDIQLWGESIN
ncbi:MAG: hypothetical protein J6V25_03600 [Oscillospiraceae bacterium]|nr:hypothetical protein [Oscillospiraceae bacterium]